MSGKRKQRVLGEPREIKEGIQDATRVLLDRVNEMLVESNGEKVRWRPPWRSPGHFHSNVLTPWRPYKGPNQVISQLVAEQKGYDEPRWITARAAEKLGGKVMAGEEPLFLLGFQRVITTRPVLDNDGTWSTTTKLDYRVWQIPVFNVAQCDGLPEFKRRQRKVEPWVARQEGDRVISSMPNPPTITHETGASPCYSPPFDHVQMPLREQFNTPGDYYETIFHELAHSTMHPDRLCRKDSSSLAGYATEELIAEFGAAHVMNVIGLRATRPIEQPASYLAHWCSVLKREPAILVACAFAGEKAGRYILGKERAESNQGMQEEKGMLPTRERAIA